MKKLIISLLILILLFGTIIIYLDIKAAHPDIKIHISELYRSESRVGNAGEDYFYLENQKLYRFGSENIIYDFECDNVYLKSYDNKIWAYTQKEKDNMLVIDKDGKIVNIFTVPKITTSSGVEHALDFIVDKNILYCSYINEYVKAYYIEEYELSEWIPEYSPIFEDGDKFLYRFKNNNVTAYKLPYFQHLLIDSEHNEHLYNNTSSEILNITERAYLYLQRNTPNGIVVVKQLLSADADKELIIPEISGDELSYKPYYCIDLKNAIYIAVSRSDSVLPSIRPREPVFEEMKNHDGDVLSVFDIVNEKYTYVYKTKKFERVLYSDTQKAITYYDHSYYTYSLEDWTVINTMPANEIHEGGSYVFDTCGEYIFVFDGDSGELLNKIKI
ncbi:MAG: hypothetical protein E7510_09880 [Ruminococcus sp.]|nr:hypothetical protein [Ruminococcus sp.]